MEKELWVSRVLRAVAGAIILIAVLLYFIHSEYWIWFIAFVGANLLQSAFSNWCPMMTLLRYFRRE